MIAAPELTPLAIPVCVPIVATEVSEELQVTLVVMSCVLLSEYFPVAVKSCESPTLIVAALGVTAIELSVGEVTVSVVEPLMLPDVALINEVPAATPVARPPVVIVATLVVAEFQVTLLVRFCVVESV